MGLWWRVWGGLVQRLVASLGSLVSLVAFVFVFFPQPVKLEGMALGLVALTVILAVASVLLEWTSERNLHRHRRIFEQSDSAGIKQYMRHWIGHSGRAAVWSRDLSWVNDDETRSLLMAKAKSGNLDIYMPLNTAVGDALRAAGATLHVYGDEALQVPESRFTIAFFGNGGSKVAIGRVVNGLHVIEELGNNEPAFFMASDLIRLARLLAKK